MKNWSGDQYNDGNWVQHQMNLKFLENVNVRNKTVLDAGCGVGNISYEIIKRGAKFVLGVDLSDSMINKAKELYSDKIDNLLSTATSSKSSTSLQFLVASIDTFKSDIQYDLIVSFFVIHWVKNKEVVIKNMYHQLNTNGEMLFTILTDENPSTENAAFTDLSQILMSKYPHHSGSIKSFSENYKNSVRISPKNLEIILKENLTCEILKYEIIFFSPNFKDEEHLKQSIRPLIFGSQLLQLFPQDDHESIFKLYIDCLIPNLIVKSDNSYDYPMSTTLVHIKKK